MSFLPSAWYLDGGPQPVIYDMGTTNSSSGAAVAFGGLRIIPGVAVLVNVCEATATAPGTLSDGTNTYSVLTSKALGGSAGWQTVFVAYNCTGLASATLTYTKNVSGSKCSVGVVQTPSAITSASPVDTSVTASGNGTTSSPSVTSGTPTQQGDLFLAFGGWSYSSALTLTQPATGNPVALSSTTTQTTASIGGAYWWGNYSGAQSYAPTLSGTPTGNALIIVGLKMAASGAGYYGVSAWAASAGYSVGQIVRQFIIPSVASERTFVCAVAGTSGATEPTWTLTSGAKTTDNTVTWFECTGKPAVNGDATHTPTWTASTATAVGQIIQDTAGDTYFICTTSSGSTGATQPTWSKTAGATTSDGSNVWTSLGAISSFAGWGAPHARMAAATATNWLAAGNSLYVASEHGEFTSGATSYTFSTTTGLLDYVFCVDKINAPPVDSDFTTGATIYATGAVTLSGNVYGNGLTVVAGAYAASNGNIEFSAAGYKQRWDNCSWVMNDAATGNSVWLASGKVEWRNCSVAQLHGSNCLIDNLADFLWIGGSVLSSNIIGTLFGGAQGAGNSNAIIDGVNLTNLGSGGTLVAAINNPGNYYFVNCEPPSGFVPLASQADRGSPRVYISTTDTSNTTWRQEVHDALGDLTPDTTDVRSGGASDGTTPISWKAVTSANPTWGDPFECIEIFKYCKTTGSQITVSIPILSSQTLTNAQIWLEASYLGSSSSPLATLLSTAATSVLDAGTAWATDSVSSWTTTGVSTPVQQTLSATFTPELAGLVRIKIKIAAPSVAVRIDPKIQGF